MVDSGSWYLKMNRIECSIGVRLSKEFDAVRDDTDI